MANLTFLNDGSVSWNLKTRYQVRRKTFLDSEGLLSGNKEL
jgi:hypothetical protein